MDAEGGRDTAGPRWAPAVLSLLSGVVLGLGVNGVWENFGWHAFGVSGACLLVLYGGLWLRRFPPTSRLSRFGSWLLLGTALAATICAVVSSRWSGYATIAAAVFAAGAALVPVRPSTKIRVLAGALATAACVLLLGLGSSALTERKLLLGAAILFASVVGIARLVVTLKARGAPPNPRLDWWSRTVSAGLAFFAGGVAIDHGVSQLLDDHVKAALLPLCVGLAAIGWALYSIVDSTVAVQVIFIVTGLVFAVPGVMMITDRQYLGGAIGVGAALLSIGYAAILLEQANFRERARSWWTDA